MSVVVKTWRYIARNPSGMVGLALLLVLALIAVLAPWIAPHSPYDSDTSRKLLPPCRAYWLGTDELGRDLLSRLIVGSRFSLVVGFVSVAVGLAGGLVLGSLAGYYGGKVDRLVMLLCDILLAFPGVLLALAIAVALGPGLTNTMLAVGLSSVPLFTRLVRGQFLSLRESTLVESARAVGSGDLRIMRGYLLPNSWGPVVVQATLRLASAILMAATLSFLGLGAQPPEPEWGAMLSGARTYLWVAPHLAVFPGLCITVAVIAINLVGDSLRDALDPRLRQG